MVKYPSFCAIDVADWVAHGRMYTCGYGADGNEHRVEPLHSRDPYMDFSVLRFWAPSLYGRHDIADL